MTTGDARLVLLGWSLFGLSGVVRMALIGHAFDRPVSVWELADPMLGASIWAALTPLASWLVRTFPLAPGTKLRGGVALVTAGPLLVAVHMAIFRSVVMVVNLGSLEPHRFWRALPIPDLSENFVRVLLVVWPLLATLHAVAHTRQEQAAALRTARLEAEVAEARLATARAEVDPAFLLGTLDGLGPLILRDPRAAEEVIVRLGDLLRARDADGATGAPVTRDEIVREIQLLSDAGFTARSPAGS